jgi:hypothetical protein
MYIYILHIYIYPSSEEAVRSNFSTCRWALDPTGGSLPDEVRCAFRQVVFYGWVLPTDPAPAGQISLPLGNCRLLGNTWDVFLPGHGETFYQAKVSYFGRSKLVKALQ